MTLTERLREGGCGDYCDNLESEAADKIDHLRALLRECLPKISEHLRDKVQQTLGSE